MNAKPKRKYIKKVIVTDQQTTPEARAERLRRVRNLANLSRQAMCDTGEININTYKGWEIARYGGLPVDGAERVVNRVQKEGVFCSIDWLLYEIGSGPYVMPNYQQAQTDSKKTAKMLVIDKEEEIILQEMMLFRSQYRDCLDIQIDDDGMAPNYVEGDFVAGVKHYGGNIQNLVGQNCIVQTLEGDLLVRRIHAHQKTNHYTLQCINHNTAVKQPTLYDVELSSAAPILRHYRRHQKLINKR